MALALLSLTAANPAPSATLGDLTGAPPVSPIGVRSCTLSASKAGSIVWIAFANDTQAVADRVRIRVSVPDHDSFEITDRGTFTPGVTVDRAFRAQMNSAVRSGSAAACRASYAHFDDGSTWAP